MEHSSLYAPWRIEYLRALSGSTGCFLCEAAAAKTPEEQHQRLVLWMSEHSVVLLNRYPYANGHLLISPKAHKAELGDLGEAELLDLQLQTIQSIALLKQAVSAQGFNLGVNLGRCAGAGVPGHLHQHVVPRWGGDTNFMAVIGEVRVVPQAVMQLYEELLRCRARMTGAATPPAHG